MKLEEAIQLLKEMQENALIACRCYKTGGVLYRDKKAEQKVNAIETVLQALEKKDTLINTMKAEFERLEDLEDNTDMLKLELKKKDEIIDEMAYYLSDFGTVEEICKHQTATFCDDAPDGVTLDVCAICIKQYFERKVEDK